MPNRRGDTLTLRQERMLTFFREYVASNGLPPTMHAIMEGVGISSTSVVSYNLKELARKGHLERAPDAKKGQSTPYRLAGDGDRLDGSVVITLSDAEAEAFNRLFGTDPIGTFRRWIVHPLVEIDLKVERSNGRSSDNDEGTPEDGVGAEAERVQGDGLG